MSYRLEVNRKWKLKASKSHVDDLSWIIYYLCEYIQTVADVSVINVLETNLLEAACGPDPSPGCELPDDLQAEFTRCSVTFSINRDWQNTVGSQIVLWLRNHY